MKTQGDRKRLYSVEEAGEYLAMSPNSVRKMVMDHVLVSVRLGSRLFISREDMHNLIEASRTAWKPHDAFVESARKGHTNRAKRRATA